MRAGAYTDRQGSLPGTFSALSFWALQALSSAMNSSLHVAVRWWSARRRGRQGRVPMIAAFVVHNARTGAARCVERGRELEQVSQVRGCASKVEARKRQNKIEWLRRHPDGLRLGRNLWDESSGKVRSGSRLVSPCSIHRVRQNSPRTGHNHHRKWAYI